MSFIQTEVNGQVMWESCDKERFKDTNNIPKDLCGWHQITIDGKVMWESPEGERSFGV
jgi:hypothetical protein